MNNMNLNVIDRKIEMLKQLKEILADEEMRAFAREVIMNSNGSHHNGERTRHGHNGNSKRGALIQSVLKTAKTLDQPFTIYAVLAAMSEKGFEFRSAKPTIAVGGAVRKLAKTGKVKLVKEGSGSIGNEYEIA